MSVALCRFIEGEEKTWDAYVMENPNAGHCHFSAWRQVISEAYGHRPYYLWHREDGKVRGILPLISMRTLALRRTLVSLPFLDDGGICADNVGAAAALVQAALEMAETDGIMSLDLRHRHQEGLNLPSHGDKVTLVLELKDDPDLIWKGFNAKVRNQVRKAEKSGLSHSWHGSEGLADFYDVFAVNMRSLGSPVHRLQYFKEIFRRFENAARLVLIRKEKQVVGGAIALLFKDTVFVPWASSLRTYRSLCPNNLLYWEAIRWACEAGYRRFDFGRSSPGAGTYHFKKQWGAIEEALHWQCWTKDGTYGVMAQGDNPLYRAMISLWRQLPLAVTKWIGPAIRGRISN